MSKTKQIIATALDAQFIGQRIFTIRGLQVMLDSDLAELYGVETKRLNEQVKRNLERFPSHFRMQLTLAEKQELVAICDRFEMQKHSASLPFVFTEQGVSMLSAVLKSDTAVQVSIQIIDAFVAMRRFVAHHAQVFQRMDRIEMKQIECDSKFEKVFQALESMHDLPPKQGIFFDGQVFDSHAFMSGLVKSAKKSLVLIDNYIDESVLVLFSKRAKNVSLTLLTKNVSQRLELDVRKFNEQYPPIALKAFAKAHDRFLIVDGTTVYHIGASLKDLGKKWFAFSKMDLAAVDVLKVAGEV